MADIIPIRVQSIQPPNEALVIAFETLLAEAKAGRLRSAAFTTLHENNRIVSAWEIDPGTEHLIAAGIVQLGHEYMAEVMAQTA